MHRLKYKEIISILEKNGFSKSRTNGSHAQYKGFINGETKLVTVICNHLNEVPDPKTFKSMIRQSGLEKSAFR